MFKLRMTTVVFCLFCLWLAAPRALAQTQPAAAPPSPVASTPEVQLLRAILEEQRLMRITLQRTYVNAYRAQMLTERLARQQARVDSLGEEITQLKSLIQQSQEASRDEDEVKDLLATINETADPQQRAALIQSYNSLKRSLERQREYARQEAERSRERQQQLELSQRAEQAKLAELQEQLDALDREFDRQLGETRKNR
ncbi:MAG: hypothetical protein M3X11_14455 [Acidobacteriota bacterium]|nr:hypothetical protein [Acidobacteriota bacterium]